jgi:hypothetical protein
MKTGSPDKDFVALKSVPEVTLRASAEDTVFAEKLKLSIL